MNNSQFEYMVGMLLASAAEAVRNQEQLFAAQKEMETLRVKIADLEWQQRQARAVVPQSTLLTAQVLADLMLGDRGKIQAIKAVRAMTGMGLKESKDLVDAAAAEALAHRTAGTLPNRVSGY